VNETNVNETNARSNPALKAVCPTCCAQPGVTCKNLTGKRAQTVHSSRISVARDRKS
jgi:hypothetical protein